MPKVPLVGSYFRPPATLVLKGLLGGSVVTLVPEPSNPYDENAIAAYACPSDMEQDYAASTELADGLEGMGREIQELLAEPNIHLGYVARTHTAIVREHFGHDYGTPVGSRLVWGGDGKPWLELDNPQEPEPLPSV